MRGNMNDELNIQGVGMTSQRTRLRLVERLREQGIKNELVLSAIGDTPRHAFIDEALAHRAYEDTALPIGFNQTISQPFVVAKMTEALLADGEVDSVLEIGTGSGYQTAILAQLAKRVYTVERISGLQRRAKFLLKSLGYRNIQFKYDDGNLGWEEFAPFDAIMITAAPRALPEALAAQLGEGGRMLVPLGADGHQELLLISKTGKGLDKTLLGHVRFVPLLGGRS